MRRQTSVAPHTVYILEKRPLDLYICLAVIKPKVVPKSLSDRVTPGDSIQIGLL